MRFGYGRVPCSESKNGFLILDLPDFAVFEGNAKSEIGFVTLATFRNRVQEMTCLIFHFAVGNYCRTYTSVRSRWPAPALHRYNEHRTNIKLPFLTSPGYPYLKDSGVGSNTSRCSGNMNTCSSLEQTAGRVSSRSWPRERWKSRQVLVIIS